MSLHRRSGEHTDQVLTRFVGLRYQAAAGGGFTMNLEGYSWLLLCGIGATSQQLLQILQPYQQRFPSTEADFNSMQMTIRRKTAMAALLHSSVSRHSTMA